MEKHPLEDAFNGRIHSRRRLWSVDRAIQSAIALCDSNVTLSGITRP